MSALQRLTRFVCLQIFQFNKIKILLFFKCAMAMVFLYLSYCKFLMRPHCFKLQCYNLLVSSVSAFSTSLRRTDTCFEFSLWLPSEKAMLLKATQRQWHCLRSFFNSGGVLRRISSKDLPLLMYSSCRVKIITSFLEKNAVLGF